MQDVPKIVLERLKAAMPVGHHPDADVLTAFAEYSLPQDERAAVLEHLARCGDCREVLALALPPADAGQTVVAPIRGGWPSWSVLRWGFVAAGGVAIVSLGILQYERQLQPVPMVAKQTKAEPVAGYAQNQPATPPTATSAEKQEKPWADALSAGATGTEMSRPKSIAPSGAPQGSARQQRSSEGIGGSVASTQLLHGPAMPTQWQQQTARVRTPPAPSAAGTMQKSIHLAERKEIPPSSQMAPVETSSQAVINAETQNRTLTQDQDSPIQSSQPAQEFEYPSGAIGKAKPAANVRAGNTASGQGIGGPVVQSSSGLKLTQWSETAPVPRWTISPTGGLQRSFDQGQTWQDVDVNPNGMPKADATSVAVVGGTAGAKDVVADKKTPLEPAAPLVFRSVTAIGQEVWAGGSNGALYHSLDAGSHWTQVVPSTDGVSLAGDIVGLEFPDAQHGKVTTSTTETWITGDGGQTWQKQ